MTVSSFQAMDLFEQNSAYEIQVAPDRQWLVYVRHSFDIKTDTQITRLWRINADGSDHRPLTGAEAAESAPRISPCGGRVAFVSNKSGTQQIHVYDIDSGENRQLTAGFLPPSLPAWSPDGEHIAYFAPAFAEPVDFADISVAPEGAQWAPPPQIITRLPYKIDKIGYLPHIFQQLHVVPAGGGEARQLTHGQFDHIVYLAPQNPVWSADAKEILVCANPEEQHTLKARDSGLYAVSLADQTLRRLGGDFKGSICHAAYSPNGEQIAFLGFSDMPCCHPQFQLFIMDSDGDNIMQLAADLDRSLGESLDNGGSPLQFADDGQSLFVMYSDRGSTRLGRFYIDGTRDEVARDLGSGMNAYAALGSFGLLQGGALVFNQALGNQLPELYVQPPGKTPRALTEFNSALRSERRPGEITEFWCKNSDDDTDIHGWLLRPPHADPAKPLPLILDIHGGPHGDYGDRFWIRNQAMAAAGYAVLLCNPRGSTSYGHAFTRGIEHCYPGPDIGDLMAAVDACIERGWANPDALFVMGGSGGGALTAACVAYSDRFRAAACLYPVIDWPSLVLSADVTPFMRHWRSGMPWEVPEEYLQHSLLRHIDKVSTPTIVMCGSDDLRTPFHHAEMFYQALKFRGVDTALVRFEGEAHGMSGRPSHAVQTIELILNWFQKYR